MTAHLARNLARLTASALALAVLAGCSEVVDVREQVELLRTGDQREREEAQTELVQAGMSAVNALAMELRNPDSAIKKSVVRVLGQIGERDRAEDILLSKSRDDTIQALIDVALSDDKRSIGPIDDPAYLQDIAKALGAFDDERVAEPLMMMYAEAEDAAVRVQARDALRAVGHIGATTIDRFRKKAEPGSLLAKGVKEIVERLSDKLSKQVAQKKRGGFLLLGSDEKWEDVRVGSAKALALVGITKTAHMNRLLATLSSPGEDHEMRAAICKAIGDRPVRDIRRPQNRDALRDAMKDENALVAVYAARALAKAGDTEAISKLLQLSKGEYTEELDKLSEEERLAKLRTWERDERVRSNEVRVLAAQALGDVGRTAVDQLAERIFDDNKNVRWAAVDALGRIGGEVAMGALVTSLVSEGELADITVMATMWLGQNADRRAIRPLIRMLEDTDERVRWTARWGLQRLADNPKTAEAALHSLNQALRSSAESMTSGQSGTDETITRITDEAYRLQRELGAGLAEAVYQTAFLDRLRTAKADDGASLFTVTAAPALPIVFAGKIVGRCTADAIVNGSIVLEIASVGQLTGAHEAAVRSYLDRSQSAKAAHALGLLVNFMRDPLESRKVTRVTAQLAEANVYRVAEVLTVVGDESSIAPLCAAIADPLRDPTLRIAALDAVLSIAGRIDDITPHRPTIKAAFAAALASKPVDEEATDEELADHAKVRMHAAKTIAATRWDEAKSMLTEARAAEEDESAQAAIDEELTKLGQE